MYKDFVKKEQEFLERLNQLMEEGSVPFSAAINAMMTKVASCFRVYNTYEGYAAYLDYCKNHYSPMWHPEKQKTIEGL